ncbi:MAG: 2-oxo acid dehydrogenase subunit E2 [Devosia sp.]|nr:2-oxo acid dehydrogenase subunit E2 [Devosia sp.]
MSNRVFNLPDIGEGVAEAELVAWHVRPGDSVEEDAPLLDVMTDKATVEMTAPFAGRIVATHGEVGALIAVGSPLVEFETGEIADAPPAVPARPERVPRTEPMPAPAADAVSARTVAAPAALSTSRSLASPAVRHAAFERGIALQYVHGSGPAGRVVMADLDAFAALGPAHVPAAPPTRRPERITETKVVGLRRRIAEKMQLAKRHIPHFSYIEELDLTGLEAIRRDLNETAGEGRPKLTLLPFFMRALALAIPDFPVINSHYDEDAGLVRTFGSLHVGIATQTVRGLLVPVVRDADDLDLWGCATGLARVVSAARTDRAAAADLTGSSITLTSLGTLGGVAATPIINAPEVAIVAPNKLVERPVVIDGAVEIRTMMNLSASFDHRIVDGHYAASFIQRLKWLIERPALLVVAPR